MAFYFDQLSLGTCKIRGFWYFSSEIFSQWLMVALVCERLYIISYPFKAKGRSSARNGIIIAIALYISSALQAIPVIIGYNLVDVPAYINRKVCLPLAAVNSSVGLMITFISTFSMSIYSTFSMCILTAILGVKLAKLSRRRLRCFHQNRLHVLNSNEISSSLSVITLSIMQCILYIPSAFFWGSFSASNIVKVLSPEHQHFLVVGGKFFLSLTIISKIWNIYVYLIRVKNFKEDLLRLVWCK